MERQAHQPQVVMTVHGAGSVTLHETVFGALASMSDPFRRMRQHGTVSCGQLKAEIERLVDPETELPDHPKAWRFVQTSNAYLGPAFFSNTGKDLVASAGDSAAYVTDTGFAMQTTGSEEVRFMAIETTKTQTALILPDGHESGPLLPDEITLAQHLTGGNPYVTAVPASFGMAAQQPLYRLRAHLYRAYGNVSLV